MEIVAVTEIARLVLDVMDAARRSSEGQSFLDRRDEADRHALAVGPGRSVALGDERPLSTRSLEQPADTLGGTQRVEPRSVRVSQVSCMDLGYSQLPGVPSAGFV